MHETDGGDDSLDELAEEFARRCRAGETPSAEEYAHRYPGREGEVRAVLSAVARIEQLRPQRAPQRLGEFRIVREIGRGGMGIVYEAEQPSLSRRVAVKVLPPHLVADERLRSRFRREAKAAARLHHPNIVPVFGIGEADGQCFYAMQLIEGVSLNQAIGGQTVGLGPLTAVDSPDFFRAAALLGRQVAAALEYAHAHGVLHRDVKPANLLVDGGGNAWVTDFGVAKLLEEANLTRTGDVVGTLRYMPPEQLRGRSDIRSDVYSLGATLYELLTSRPPFPDAPPAELMKRIGDEDPPPLTRHNPAVPADLEAVILKAMARDPGRRHPTAAALADDLQRFLDGQPVQARRPGRWPRRRAVVGAAVAVAVLLGLAVWGSLPKTPAVTEEPDREMPFRRRPWDGPKEDGKGPFFKEGKRGRPPWSGGRPPGVPDGPPRE